MPAPPLANTFETGIADTTVITTVNSDDGSAGDAFSAITGSPTFSTTHAKSGTLAMRIDTTGTHAETHVDWTGLGSITTSVWFRFYMYMTAYPVGSVLKPIGIKNAAAANSGFLQITNTTGVLRAMNAAQVGTGTAGTVPPALNQWIRIEFRILSSTTVGEIEWWLYNTPDAAVGSFDDHVNTTGMVLAANTDQGRFGSATATGPNSFVAWYDDFAVSSTAQIGPSLVTDTGLAWLTA